MAKDRVAFNRYDGNWIFDRARVSIQEPESCNHLEVCRWQLPGCSNTSGGGRGHPKAGGSTAWR